jgi:hypothetical protein
MGKWLGSWEDGYDDSNRELLSHEGILCKLVYSHKALAQY